jgi:hypothetical protein
MQDAHGVRCAGARSDLLDLPNPQAVITPVLLDDPRARRLQPREERSAELGGGAVKVRIGTPAKMLCAVQDFFDPHLEDHVGVRADPGAPRGDVAQQRVEFSSGLAALDRIDPHEHPICAQELLAHLVGEGLIVDRRLGIDADGGKLLEDPVKAIVLWGRGLPGFGIATPEDRDPLEGAGFEPSVPLVRT